MMPRVLVGTLVAVAGVGALATAQKPSPPTIERDPDGNVTITAAGDAEVRYWISAAGEPAVSRRYTGPFALPRGGVVTAVSIPPDGKDAPVGVEGLFATAEFGPIEGQEPAGAPTAPDPAQWSAGWEMLDPEVPPLPDDVDQKLPLSDQANAGDWVRYEPLWDEFESDTLDEGKWWPTNPGWKGRQPAAFLASNVEVKDGKLNLSMRAEEPPEELRADGYHTFTSAAVQSKTTVRYGYFEVKARPMRSRGSSSFWFYNSTEKWWTEIDVFEIGAGAPGFEKNVHITLHVMRTPTIKDHFAVGAAIWKAPKDLADEYRVYGLEWDESELRFYVNGVLVRRGPNTHWHQPLTLNFDSETMPEWFGLPTPEELPSTFSVEYVRSWKRG